MEIEERQPSNYAFSAFLDNLKMFYSVLKAISFQESAIFCASGEGLRVTVELNKCVQASAYIPSKNFWEYHISDEKGFEFKINTTVLTECLNIFGTEEETSLKIIYKSQGSPLILILENKSKNYTSLDNFITDCEIKIQEADELMYFKGNDDVVELGIIVVNGSQFMSILNDFEKSTETIEITIDPDKQNINITTVGPLDTSDVNIPKTCDMVILFSCTSLIKFRYKFSHIRLMMKTLALATKSALKFDSRGLLLVQHEIQKVEDNQMFIEFYITALLDDEE